MTTITPAELNPGYEYEPLEPAPTQPPPQSQPLSLDEMIARNPPSESREAPGGPQDDPEHMMQEPSSPTGPPALDPNDQEVLNWVRPVGRVPERYSAGDCLFDVFVRLPWFIFSSIVYFLTFPIVGCLDLPLLQLRPRLQRDLIDVVLRTLQMWIALSLCEVYMAFQIVYESDKVDFANREMLHITTVIWEIMFFLSVLVAAIYIIGNLMYTLHVPLIDWWFGLTAAICAFVFRIFIEDWSFVVTLSKLVFFSLVLAGCVTLIISSIATTKICGLGDTWFRRKKYDLECDIYGLTGGHCISQIIVLLLCHTYIPMRSHDDTGGVLEQQYQSLIRSRYYLLIATGAFLTLTIIHGIDRLIPAVKNQFIARTADSFKAGLGKYIDCVLGFLLGSLFVPVHRSFGDVEMVAFANLVTVAIALVFVFIGAYETTMDRSNFSKYNHIKVIYSRTAAFMVATVWNQTLVAIIESQSTSKILLLVYKSIYGSLCTFAWIVIGLAVTQLKQRVVKEYVRSARIELMTT